MQTHQSTLFSTKVWKIYSMFERKQEIWESASDEKIIIEEKLQGLIYKQEKKSEEERRI